MSHAQEEGVFSADSGWWIHGIAWEWTRVSAVTNPLSHNMMPLIFVVVLKLAETPGCPYQSCHGRRLGRVADS
jgi:hypothetical protein